MVTALTIAGVDSSGGAGVTADIKTFAALGVWGTCAVTAVTAQDTTGVHARHAVPANVVRAQIDAVVRDIGVDAVKVGMLATRANVVAVAASLPGDVPVVVDPVLVSTSGTPLLDPRAVDALRTRLVGRAAVVTPNLAEAAVLTGVDVIADRAAMTVAARALVALGAQAALVTGGHLAGDAADCLAIAGEPDVRWLEGGRIESVNTHGTGCVLSAAIAAELARGLSIVDACVAGKRFVEAAIAGGVALGAGPGAVDPMASPPGATGGADAAHASDAADTSHAPGDVARRLAVRRLVGVPTIAGLAVSALVGIVMILTGWSSSAVGRLTTDAALVGVFGLIALAGAHWVDHRRFVALGVSLLAISAWAVVLAMVGVHVHHVGSGYAHLMEVTLVALAVLVDVSALVGVTGVGPLIDRLAWTGVAVATVLGTIAVPLILQAGSLGDVAGRLYGVGVVTAVVLTLVVAVLDRLADARRG